MLGTPVRQRLLLDAGMVAPARLRALLTELRGAAGLLADARCRSLLIELRRIERELDIPASILQRLAEDEQRNLAIVMKIEELAHRHARMMLFAALVEHARLLAAVLRARGLNGAAVTGDT